MTPPGTFDRVYAAIRQRLREGRYRPGARLEPAALADELNASVTPVRDALHRLTGERLVDAPRHEGFRVPMLTETLLRQLYAWHFDLLLIAVARQKMEGLSDAIRELGGQSDQLVHERQNDLFIALARLAGNAEHVTTLEALEHRLEPVQRLEQLFLDETEAETATIFGALEAHDRPALRRSLARYHRRRAQIVPQLLAGLMRGEP